MCQWETALDCRQARLVPALFFYCEAMLSQHVDNVAWHCLAEISRDIPEKDVIWMRAYIPPKPVCSFQHSWCLQRYKLPMMPWALTHLHIITDAGFEVVTISKVLFLFSMKDTTSMISTMWNVDSSGRSTLLHFVSVHLIWAQAQRSWLCFWILLIYGFLHSRVPIVFPSPCSNILYIAMSVVNTVPPEGSDIMGIHCWFSALLLICRYFFQILWNFWWYYGL